MPRLARSNDYAAYPVLGPLGEQRCFRSIYHLNYMIPFHLYRLFVIPFTMNRAFTITYDRPNAHTEESRPRSFAVPIFLFFLFFRSSATALLERAALFLLCLRSDGHSSHVCRNHERECSVRLVNAGEHSLLPWAARLVSAGYLP